MRMQNVAAIIIAAIIYANFNPYQLCKRDLKKGYKFLNEQQFAKFVADMCGK